MTKTAKKISYRIHWISVRGRGQFDTILEEKPDIIKKLELREAAREESMGLVLLPPPDWKGDDYDNISSISICRL